MNDGYVIDDGRYYYCSEECLTEVIGIKDYLEMYDVGEAYWTEFEGADDDDE